MRNSSKRAFVLAAVAAIAPLIRGIEPDEVRIRVSVKRVLSPSGALPQGGYGDAQEIARVIGRCNEALEASGAAWTILLTEVVDTRAASSFYTMSSTEIGTLEAEAKADPTGYGWRSNAINIYVVDEMDDAGGVCSFPTFGSNRETIVINSRGILGGSEGWLHEMGHYFNLIHTHESDAVADTLEDAELPSPFDCAQHDQNLLTVASTLDYSLADTQYLLYNVMSYHCDPAVLTPLQIVRMRRALLDYRTQVLVPLPDSPPPVAAIALPPEAPGGRVTFTGSAITLTLDGGASRDAGGGKLLSGRWSWTSGPSGGARFEGASQGWELGCSGIGYGDADDLTELTDMRGRYMTVYMTRAFEVEDPSRLQALQLDVAYDDGFAAYLNGQEVARRNLPAGAGVATPASSGVDDEREVIHITGFLEALRPGRNRISIEVHNSSLDSTDLTLHAILRAANPAGSLIDLVPSRAIWHFRKGSQGAPPADWKEPDFDAAGEKARVTINRVGTYRFRLTVDQGLAVATDTEEVELVVASNVFLRGDCNGDGAADISDAVRALVSLFQGASAPDCPDACDTNDDEALDISDAIALLEFIFRGGAAPPAPYPSPGEDPGGDGLRCRT